MTIDFKKIIYMLHPLERKILAHIGKGDVAKIAYHAKLTFSEVLSAVSMLEEKGFVVNEKLEIKFVGLDKFGEKYLKKDLPEISFLKQIIDKPTRKSKLKLEKDELSSAIGILKKKDLIEIEKEKDAEMTFIAKKEAKKFLKEYVNPLKLFKDDTILTLMSAEQKNAYNEMKQRKGFLKEFSKITYNPILSPNGIKLAKELISNYAKLDLIDVLTTDMLKKKSYKNKEFRHYDVNLDRTCI
jgi:DNA-binding XRE family transcriptional regulator